jgi:hypothetical protein
MEDERVRVSKRLCGGKTIGVLKSDNAERSDRRKKSSRGRRS